ncbi:MAG: fructosamine kinase family protein, partial [Xanthomonadales bacterium]|nr:fructosamine kinase family protein [Xanthomonadales bacterium]
MQNWRAGGQTRFERVRLEDGRAAVRKRRTAAPTGYFKAEAEGLHRLASVAGGLRVPQVYAQSGDQLLLEDLGRGRARPCDWETAGRALAQVHAQTAAHFGLETDGWCGDSAQDNTRATNGHAFYAQHRLLPQLRRARDAGLLTRTDASAIEGIAVRLPELLPLAPAVLLHGDLWLGNLHACADGRIALIDAAAVHYGWAEA